MTEDCDYSHVCVCCGADDPSRCGCFEKALANEQSIKEKMKLLHEKQQTCEHEWSDIFNAVTNELMARECEKCWKKQMNCQDKTAHHCTMEPLAL